MVATTDTVDKTLWVPCFEVDLSDFLTWTWTKPNCMQSYEHSTEDDGMVENGLETFFKNSSNNFSLYLIQ